MSGVAHADPADFPIGPERDFGGNDGPEQPGLTMPKRAAKVAPGSASARPLFSSLDTQVIYCGDNLDKLRELPDACVDLIYIDPPFNSNRDYEVFWGETKEKRAFEDRHASTQAYIDFMWPRCQELYRVLKDTGSFYYHCDWHAGHYVKVMLDRLFGENNFLSEIIWKRTSSHSGSRRFGPVHDTIFFYGKSSNYVWNHQYEKMSTSRKVRHDLVADSDGRLFRTSGPARTLSRFGKL